MSDRTDSRLPRTGNVIARLQALFPVSPLSQDFPGLLFPECGPQTTSASPPQPERRSLKVRIMSWNMHESLPKGDLEELLGRVPSFEPVPVPSGGVPSFPNLPTDPEHPYHLVIVAGQECPSASGIPLALGAGFKLKEKEKDRKDGKDIDEKDPDLSYSRSLRAALDISKEGESDRPRSRSRNPVGDNDHDDRQSRKGREDESLLSNDHAPARWTSMLEDWYGHPSLSSDTKPRRDTPDPFSDEMDESTCTETIGGEPDSSHSKPCRDQKKGPYELLIKERMMGLYLAIFIHRDLKPFVRGSAKSAVTAGLIGGRVGNKGGVGISLNIDGTTLLFVNAHLAAHEGKMHSRLANLAKIKAELSVDDYLSSNDPRFMAEDISDRFDFAFIFGDLNFRLDVTRLHADWMISRKDYAQALEFDQLRKVIKSGLGFVGFEEGPINFPPTFKYDVLRYGKRQKRRSQKRISKVLNNVPTSPNHDKLLSEVEERVSEEQEAEDECERDGEATSVTSSVYTRYTTDPEADPSGEEDFFPPTSPSRASTSNLVHKIWSKAAAHKAKSKWMSLIASPVVPRTPNSKWSKWKQSLGDMPPTPSIFKTTTFPPTPDLPVDENYEQADIGRRPMSAKSARFADEEEDIDDKDRGVYDTSAKQRVPSWCDRILWKSTVEPEPESGPSEFLSALSPIPRTRMGQFLQALRPSSLRSRKDSTASSAEIAPLEDVSDSDSSESEDGRIYPVSRNRQPNTSRKLSYSTSLESFSHPTKSVIPRNQSHAFDTRDQGSHSRKHSLPTSLNIDIISPSSPITPSELTITGQSSIPPPLPPRPSLTPRDINPSRWRFLPFLHRDIHTPSLSERPPTPENPPSPRKGDVVCLGYNTLDDRGMRRLQGRSDHRPVIGSYAIYI